MRQEIDPAVIAHIMDMLAFGLVGMDDFIPREKMPPTEAVIEGIAAMMDRAFTPDGVDPEKGKIILLQLANAGRQQFEMMKQEEDNDDQR